jgi:hypothetical protein
MLSGNPQLSALAFLVYKFGEKLSNGGYEVRVTAADMTKMSRHGIFQEVPDVDGRGVRWQYFPNHVIDIKPEEPSEATVKVEKKDAE